MKRLILSIVLATLCGISAFAYDFSKTSNGVTLYYNITSSTSPYTVAVTSQNTTSPYYSTYPTGNLTIPSSVTYNSKTYSVTSIGSKAFYNCSGITSVTIPSSVTSIASDAFYSCSGLTKVNYSGTIAQWCGITFNGNPLSHAHNLYISNSLVTNLVIPNTVTVINARAFSGATCLTSVTIPSSVTSIGSAAFSGCSGLTEIAIPNSVTSIGNSAFSSCRGLTTVSIPNSVLSIGESAFSDCSGLSGTLTIPNSVTSIGRGAFSRCSGLTSVTIGNSVTSIGNNAFGNCSGLTSVTLGNAVATIGESAFYNCSGLTGEIIIPNSVTSIGDLAFYYCSKLSSLTIGNSVSYIGASAFVNCYGLTGELKIPNSVNNIGRMAFKDCISLTSLIMGDSVVSIGDEAFCGCSNIKGALTIPNTVTSIGDYAFYECVGLSSVHYTGNIAEWCGITFGLPYGNYYSNPLYYAHNLYINNELLTDLIIPDSITSIPNNAFFGASCLTSLYIPSAVTSIGTQAFVGCSGLTSITVDPDNSTYDSRDNCNAIIKTETNELIAGCKNTAIPNSVIGIGNYAFAGCVSLTSITIPSSVTNIGYSAFSGCTGLTSTIIPSSVASIGNSAFYRVKNITYSGTATGNPWGALTVNGYVDGYLIYSDDTKTNLTGCSTLATEVDIPNSVTRIGEYAFSGCAELAEITIPSSVSTIGSWAFEHCNGLTSFIIPNSVDTIGDGILAFCSGLQEITIPFVGCNSSANQAPALKLFGRIFYGYNLIDGDSFSGMTAVLQIDGIDGYFDDYYTIKYNIPSSIRTVIITGGDVSFGAFSRCSMIKSITIGNSVTSIEDLAFSYCSGLTDIYANHTTPLNCTDDVFANSNHNATIWVPCGSVGAYSSATGWSDFSDIRGHQTYIMSVSSSNIQQGSASIISQPNCTNGTAIISATPAEGYSFAQWNDGNTDNPRTITVTSDTSFTASFGALRTITVASADETMGTVSGSGVYADGSQVIISATANEHYYFVQWTDGNTDNPRTITVAGDVTYTATFAIDQHTITVASSNSAMGTVNGAGTYNYGSEIQISAIANEHYHFVQWSDGNTENPRTITVESDTTFTATFDEQHYIAYNATAAATGNWVENSTYTDRNTWDSNTGDGVLYLKSGVTTIGGGNSTDYSPFCNNTNLVSVDLGNSGLTTIGVSAFNNCSGLTSVTIGNSVTSIGLGAFSGCSGLVEMVIPFVGGNALASEDSESKLFGYIFGNLSYEGGIDVRFYLNHPSGERSWYYIPSGLRSVTVTGGKLLNCAFCNCSMLTSVIMGNSVESIGDYAFYGCSGLTSVTIPNSVTNIGEDSFNIDSGVGLFSGCSELVSIIVDSGNPIYDSRDNCNAIIETATNTLVAGCKNSVIPGSVTSIGDGAFEGCGGLISVEIPNSITSIGEYAFGECSGLAGMLIIPNSVTSIGETAFYGCSYLTGLTIGNSVESIGIWAFAYCDGLTDIYANPITPPTIPVVYNYNQIFSTYTATLWVPCGSAEAYSTADDWSNFSNIREIIGYTLNVSSSNPQHGTTSVTYPTTCAENATISAIPASHYHFVQWNDGNTENPRTITEHTNATYTATFSIDQHTITIASSNSAMGTVNGDGTYNYGSEIQISAIANEHYHFVQWNDGNTDNPRTINITENATYIAEFAIDQYSVTVSSGNPTFGTVSGGGTYDYGSEIQISAIANDHYHFVQWNDGNTDNPRTITVESDTIFTATFAIDQFAVTVESANEIMGTVSGSGTYNYGTETQISATANEHYHFVQWNDGNTENPRTITVAEEATYTAEFAIDQHTITVVSSNETMGAVSGGGTFDYGTETQISATPVEHHHFVSWNDGNTDNPRTITVTADTTYTATFAVDVTNYTITAVSANPNYGTVTGGGTYAEGTEITLTAMPNEGYEFVQWNDESTENPRTITVTEDAIYIATFAAATIPTIYNEFTAAACESYTWNDSIYTESGDYTQTFIAASSADSIVTLHLTIYPLPQPEITVDGILDACNPETASVTLSTEEYDSYVWSTGEITSAIEVTEPNVYYVEVVDGHGCHGVSEMTTVGYSSVLTEAPQIRLVGMSSSGKNVLLWNVASADGIAGYEIYREDNVANVFNCIDRVERPNARNYIDLTSEPGARAYRYKICTFDECGGRSPMSDFHKTMHLTINRGVGTNWNLIWSHYEGLEFDTYKIYRGTSPRDMVMIGEMPSTLNSFTDLTNTLEEGMYYRVEIVTNNGAKNEEISLSSNIVANEFVDNYTITAISNNVTYGTVSGSGIYPAEIDITLVAIPNEGYEFVSWSDGNTENPRVITVNESATYIATFVEVAPIENYTITVVSANTEYGTVTGGGTYPEGAIISIEAIANEGYRFVQWNDGNTDNPREITVMGNATYEASFEEISPVASYTISAVSANPEYGTVTGGGTYAEGTVVSLTAEANEGYRFVQWSDGNINNPREITVTCDAIYVALFAEIPPATTYTITAVSANPEYGTVTGGGTYAEGTVVTLTAEANDGYQFLQWNDNSTDNPREITVTGDAMYIATFAPQTSIEENGLPEIAVFPNPANDFIIISSSETISEIEIVNVIGQVVMHLDVNADNVVCDVEGLKAGMYFVRIYGTDATTTIAQRKFVKE